LRAAQGAAAIGREGHDADAAVAHIAAALDQPPRLEGVDDGHRRGAVDALDVAQAPLGQGAFGRQHDERAELPGVQVVGGEHGVDLGAQPLVRPAEQRPEEVRHLDGHSPDHHLW
jgi:hypothetical protein